MKKLITTLAILTLAATSQAATRYDLNHIHYGIKNHAVQSDLPVKTVDINSSMLSETLLKFAVKDAFPRATHIKVKCEAVSCYLKFIENHQPILTAPKHVRVFFNRRVH